MATPVRVLIIDDHPLFRDALEVALAQAAPGGVETAQAGSLAAATEIAQSDDFNLILLDLNLGDTEGFDSLARLKAVATKSPVAVVSATENPSAYEKARVLGALGYLPKSLPLTELSAAIGQLLAGGSAFPENDATVDSGDETIEKVASLTPAQRRVLAGLSEGLLNKQIAHEMGISDATVKAHMTAIMRKLGATNRTQALLIYKSAMAPEDHSAA